MKEVDCKRKLRVVVGVWSETYESARGSGFGCPDLQFLVGKTLLPVEVKVGVVKDGRLFSSRIRPSQITWHDRFLKAGGKSLVIVCCGNMNCWLTPAVNREVLSKWREGWSLTKCKQIVRNNQMMISLSSLL